MWWGIYDLTVWHDFLRPDERSHSGKQHKLWGERRKEVKTCPLGKGIDKMMSPENVKKLVMKVF